jgi:hypothetical protein
MPLFFGGLSRVFSSPGAALAVGLRAALDRKRVRAI